MNEDYPVLLGSGAAARRAGISALALYHYAAIGQLRPRFVTSDGRALWDPAVVDQFRRVRQRHGGRLPRSWRVGGPPVMPSEERGIWPPPIEIPGEYQGTHAGDDGTT
jgi:hypothetical protein